ncbi:hypothetical protein SLE2022_028700 [Rubroshorea leprosula]
MEDFRIAGEKVYEAENDISNVQNTALGGSGLHGSCIAFSFSCEKLLELLQVLHLFPLDVFLTSKLKLELVQPSKTEMYQQQLPLEDMRLASSWRKFPLM